MIRVLPGELQEREGPIDREIVKALISVIPETWRSLVLEVVDTSEAGIEKYAHSISSPEGHKDIVVTPEEIFPATLRLARLFTEQGHRWRRVTYTVSEQDDEKWKYAVDFEYSA